MGAAGAAAAFGVADAWAPLGPRLPFAWQAQYTEPPGGAAARVGAAGAAARVTKNVGDLPVCFPDPVGIFFVDLHVFVLDPRIFFRHPN